MSEAHLEMHANEVMESVLKFNSQAAVTDEDHLPQFSAAPACSRTTAHSHSCQHLDRRNESHQDLTHV